MYCGREPGWIGRWGNPFSHLPTDVPGVTAVPSREEAVDRHCLWFWGRIASGEQDLRELAELDGKVLGCWCDEGEPCHTDTIAHAAAWAARWLEREDA